MKRKIHIYGLIDPRDSQIRYIGKTCNLKRRFLDHINPNHYVNTYKFNWIKHLRNLKLKPTIISLEIVTEENWQEKERYWIKFYKDKGSKLTNGTEGGDGFTKANKTSFKKGFIPWNKGKTGYSTSKKGKPRSQQTKQKISSSLIGKPSKRKRKVKQYDMNMNLIKQFNSITEAKKITGIRGISNVLSGIAKTAGGYNWS